MRFLLLLGLVVTLTSGTAEAQQTTAGPDEAAFFGATALVSAAGTYLLIHAADGAESLAPLYALPLPAIGATCAFGALMRPGGSCAATAGHALKWSIPGVALLSLGLNATALSDEMLYALGGALWLIIVPPIAAYEGYRSSLNVAPALVSDPATRRFVPGMRLHLSL